MKFGSVCSGIEAASVAWGPLGWKAAWLAEIEPFPSAVLAHHYPEVTNLGDMTTIARRVLTGEVEAPDLFCGGTPCQAFSVAGLRQSLDDERGNLTLKFVGIANAIDHVRTRAGKPACIVFWENVPGVLSTKDNAFGCFLAGLAGEDDPLEPPGAKWANAGAVFGPTRTVAWRTLDAQYFGVAQRRRRVFVVSSARSGFDPCQVLFEWDGLRRDSAPRREAGEAASARALGCAESRGGGGGTECNSVSDCMHGAGTQYSQTATSVAPIAAYPVGVEIGPSGGKLTDLNPTLDTRAKDGPIRNQLAGAVMQPVAYGGNNQSGPIDVATARNACASASASGRMDFETETFLVQPVAYTTKLHNTASNQSGKFYEEYTTALDRSSPPPAVIGPVSVSLRGREGGATAELGDEVGNCLRASGGGGDKPHVLTAMQVRRLTPRECERLQGFPDGYTDIPWRTYQEAQRKGSSYESLLAQRGMTLRGPSIEECPDGPRYKALGNSWAVPVARWIGARISQQARMAT